MKNPRGRRSSLTLIAFASSWLCCTAQNGGTLPEYKPLQHVAGTIRIRGDYHQKTMLKNWEKDFHAYEPDVSFDDELTSTAHAIPALVYNVADIGLLGREIAPLENLAFRRMFKYDPLEIAIATGSFDTPYEAFALGIFVNKANPIAQLSFAQARAIFGCGTGHDARTWGQLGLTGAWADKPIHVLGYPTENNIAEFFALKVLNAGPGSGPTLPKGARWNCDLKEYENSYDANDKPVISSDTFMMRELERDPYAIAYSGIASLTGNVKPLALTVDDGGPYIPFTLQTVMDRSYPLTRSMYAYINAPPGKPINAALAEFLRYILSRQGQQAVALQRIFLPLPASAVQQQREKLSAVAR